MVDLIRVRSRTGHTKTVFLVDKRLAAKYPEDYVIVKDKPPRKRTAKPTE